MLKRKTRKQNLSILLIPDDYSDPFTFKVSFRTIKILTVITALLVIHIFLGAVYYYKYSVTNRYRKQLERENINLQEDNNKVYEMYDQVEELLQHYSRLRNVLGVEKKFEVSDRSNSPLLKDLLRNKNVMSNPIINDGVYHPNISFNESKLDFFLTRVKSNYHQFASNIPTYLPVEGFLTTDFRKNDWFLPDHLGIDIAASRGSSVRAAADGVVIFANWTEDLGYLIILYHFNGFLSFYGHNQVLLLKENSFVKKGDTIALTGSSGRSTAPHLHFAIWKDGIPIDPKEYLLKFQNKYTGN